MGRLAEALRRPLRHREPRRVSKSDEQWRRELSPEQYRVLRAKGTERPFSGSDIHPTPQDRTFSCAGCGAELFRSTDQFDSGTGWPSFADALDGAVDRHLDFRMVVPRTEVVCQRCGGHLGHLFRDGPRPGGMRYCINSAALSAPPSEAP